MIYEFLRRHEDFLYSLVFNLLRPIGYLRLPTYSLTFRYGMSAVRAASWHSKIGRMGKGVQIDAGVIIRGHAKNVEIGDYSYIDTNVHLEVNKPIRIGKYVHVAPNAYIQSGDEVTIGDFAVIANSAKIYAASNTYEIPDGEEKDVLLSMSSCAPPEIQHVERAPVIIEDYAFVGINCVVLPGVTIGKGAVIGAGVVVTTDVLPYTIVIGIPARPVRRRSVPGSQA